ncbi:MAG TPA: lytic transglycosylase domain-containing protein [Rudaea sp.]|nr:lytic transglycosylase domain-containing protein [Rudaea sp.]
MRLFAVLALLAGGALACAPALAGSVYRCQGPNGQIAFTNRPGTFKQCHEVSSYADKKPVPAAEDGKPHSEYRSAPAPSDRATESSVAATAAAEPKSQATNDGAKHDDAIHDDAIQVHRGAVYKVVRANGITEYTNIKPATGATYRVLFTYMATCYACNVHSKLNWGSIPLNLDAYSDEIATAAKDYHLDPSLLRAVIHAESAFKRYAVSDKGAQGLMQLMPGTAADLGVGDPFDAGQNIRGGADYLAQLLKQFKGDEQLATAAYNAGAQNVQKYKGVPPFDETQVYVQRVATLHKRYRAAESPPVAAATPATAPRS